MKKLLLIVLVLSLIMTPCLVFVIDAQIAPVHTCTPIDGGVSILLAMGVMYGVRKLYKGRKKNISEQG